MTGAAPPATLFGLPLALRRADATLLLRALERGWRAQIGRDPEDLDSDLDAMRTLFAPTARELTLRRRLEAVDLPALDAPFLTDRLAIATDRGAVVTPEGRLVIHLLTPLLASPTDTVVLEPPVVSWAHARAYDFYRHGALNRLERVLALRAGTDEPLRFPSVGLVLLLLVNRSVGSAHAIRRPSSATNRAALDEAIQKPIKRFADVLDGGGRRQTEHFSLYGGYVLTEARRRLGQHLSPDPAELYVLTGHEASVLAFVARDLNRRSTVTHVLLDQAFATLVASYRESHAALASLGLAFERPSVTTELHSRLLMTFDQVAAPDAY